MVVINVKKAKKRIFYFDALRALAITSVMIFHIFLIARRGVFSEFSIPTFNWIITDVMGACFRCGVCLFLMLSGALSLGRDWDIKTFLGKRIPRITAPFLFWGFVLSIAVILLNFYFPVQFHTIDDFSIGSIINFIINAYLHKSYTFGAYWFFWMILGTYLIMPIFNKWLLHCDLREAEYFLVIWLITCLFEFTLKMEFPLTLTYFTGPIGMVVLGYYLRHTDRKLFNNPYFSLAVFVLSNVILVVVSYLLSDVRHIHYFNRYSILVVFQVFGIFLFFKNFSKFNIKSRFLNNPDGIFRKSISVIAKYSYGIYLTHEFFLQGIFPKLLKNVPYKPSLVIWFFGSLACCLILLSLLNRIPYINQVIGAK